MNCKFNRNCKNYNSYLCNLECYPFIFLHGNDGNGGVYANSNVPSSYRDYLAENMPIKDSIDNKEIYGRLIYYINNCISIVQSGVGIYLFGGTGTGKTTTAVSILNEYIIARSKLHLKGEKKIDNHIGYFIRSADLQNVFNSQFRGNFDMQEKAASKYYRYKDIMMNVELLVLDDIATRDTTESFRNELFEIIDYRGIEGLATIYTSNVALTELHKYVGDRIASRVEGMAKPILIKGKDNRQGGLF